MLDTLVDIILFRWLKTDNSVVNFFIRLGLLAAFFAIIVGFFYYYYSA